MAISAIGFGYSMLSSDIKPSVGVGAAWCVETDTKKIFIWDGLVWTEKIGIGILDVFTTLLNGVVPAPLVSTGKVLQDDATWVAQGGVSDGDKGDITVSGGGATWSIDAGAVGTPELGANVVDSTKLFRGTTAGHVLTSNGSGVDPTYQAAPGGGGNPVWNEITKDLGVARRDGTFDITGLSGLTADKVVDIRQTSSPITSKGNARDEPEFDAIVLTGYVVSATVIRVSWRATGVVVGNYQFAYWVSA